MIYIAALCTIVVVLLAMSSNGPKSKKSTHYKELCKIIDSYKLNMSDTTKKYVDGPGAVFPYSRTYCLSVGDHSALNTYLSDTCYTGKYPDEFIELLRDHKEILVENREEFGCSLFMTLKSIEFAWYVSELRFEFELIRRPYTSVKVKRDVDCTRIVMGDRDE